MFIFIVVIVLSHIMSQKKIVTDGFVRDENGKWHIVPMKLPGGGSGKKSSEKKKQVRKYIPIERLTPANFDISPKIKPKRRKIEEPVRKELFKVPQRKSKIDTRPSFSSRQSKSFAAHRNSRNNNVAKTKTLRKDYQLDDDCPLLDIAEAEELLINQNLSLNPVIPPVSTLIVTEDISTISAHTPKKKNVLLEPTMTPCTREFVELEKTMATVTEIAEKTESPMSSVCTLLENAKLNNAKSIEEKEKKTILAEITNIIARDKNEFDLLKQQVDMLQQQVDRLQQQVVTSSKHHQENFDRITALLKQLGQDCDENKENHARKSNGIATFAKEKTKFVISPAISKKQDLRKSTLNKNLTKVLHSDVESPRMKKAVDLYNNFRTDCGLLCTPKLDRTNVDTRLSNVTRSLSRRIQKQCLLLQDTPKQTE